MTNNENDKAHNFDFSKAFVMQDETLVDENGKPRKDALIFPGNIIKCHPELYPKVMEAKRLFFTPK